METHAIDVVAFDFKATRNRCFVNGYPDYQMDYT